MQNTHKKKDCLGSMFSIFCYLMHTWHAIAAYSIPTPPSRVIRERHPMRDWRWRATEIYFRCCWASSSSGPVLGNNSFKADFSEPLYTCKNPFPPCMEKCV